MVKFVVKFSGTSGPAQTQWVDYPSHTSVATVVSNVIGKFETTQYTTDELALMNESTGISYEDDATLEDWKDGSIYVLKVRPEIEANRAVTILSSPNKDIKKEMFNLGKQLRDRSFAHKFVDLDGMRLAVECCMAAPNAGAKGYSLSCVDTILIYDIPRAWEAVDSSLIHMVTKNINSKENSNINVLRASLSIAEQCMGQAKFGYDYMASLISWDALIRLLSGEVVTEVTIKVNALSLINSILDSTMADDNEYWLDSKDDILRKLGDLGLFKPLKGMVNAGKEMGHQLYRFQHHRFSMTVGHLDIPFDMGDPGQKKLVDEIKRVAFPDDVPYDDEYLGFKDGRTSQLVSAYGLCSVQCMIIMVRFHVGIVHELIRDISAQEPRERFPLVTATVELVRIICDLCRVGMEPLENCYAIHTMFFNTGDPLEELYVVAIQLANRTWQEMNATEDDLKKVLNVVKQRLDRALTSNVNCATFAEFKTAVFSISYRSLLQQQQKELSAMQHTHADAPCVRELYASIYASVWQNVGRAKLKEIQQGAFFQKYTARGKVKGRRDFFKLAENGRVLNYNDFGMEVIMPKMEQLTKTVRVADIEKLVFARACPVIRQMKRISDEEANNAFALVLNDEESIQFIAPNRKMYCTWTDALRFLFKSEPINTETADDIKQLTSLSLQVQLMEVENEEILSAPALPPAPPLSDRYAIADTSNIV